MLDINNLYVNQRNHGEAAKAAIDSVPLGLVGEFHLGGHLETPDAVVDHHGARIAAPVWALYRAAVRRFGPVPALIEWDTDLPGLDVLLDEVRLARLCNRVDEAGTTPVGPAPSYAFPAVVQRGSSLADLQETMVQALLEPALQTPAIAMFQGTADQVTQRLGLYRGNLVATWEKVLAAAYPVLQTLVGEVFFRGLAAAYGRAHPSASGDLNVFGAHLSHFLESFAPVAQYPYFPAMARLEWLLHCAPRLPLATPLDAAALAGFSPDALDAACFTLRADCRFFYAASGVVSLWRLHQSSVEDAFATWVDQPEWALVLRAQSAAALIPLSRAESTALTTLQAGRPLGEALDLACEIDADFDFPTCLKRWLQHGVLATVAGACS